MDKNTMNEDMVNDNNFKVNYQTTDGNQVITETYYKGLPLFGYIKNSPTKLVAKGLPDGFIKKSPEKTQLKNYPIIYKYTKFDIWTDFSEYYSTS